MNASPCEMVLGSCIPTIHTCLYWAVHFILQQLHWLHSIQKKYFSPILVSELLGIYRFCLPSQKHFLTYSLHIGYQFLRVQALFWTQNYDMDSLLYLSHAEMQFLSEGRLLGLLAVFYCYSHIHAYPYYGVHNQFATTQCVAIGKINTFKLWFKCKDHWTIQGC